MLSTQAHLHAALILFVVSVAIIDWRSHRIPNLLCSVAAMLGLMSQAWLYDEAGLMSALGGATVGLVIFLPFYVLRAFGAGDVKAMATVGIFLGVKVTLLAVAATLISGAVLGLIVMFTQRSAHASRYRLLALLSAPVSAMRTSMQNTAPDSMQRFPYGVAIACGTAVTLWLTH
jgi:prepilin peptidase CpaA